MREPFPNLTSPEQYFKRPVLRKAGIDGLTQATSYDSSATHFKRVYEACNVICEKVLHQGRADGQRDLDDDDVDDIKIKRFCKYLHDEQSDSYLLNVPLQPMLSRAGFDKDSPRTAIAPHQLVDVHHAADALLPALKQQEDEINEAWKLVTTGTQAKKERLFNARGTVKGMRFMVETFIQCAAARPRDEFGNLSVDSSRLYEAFRDANPLFQLDFFDSDAFKAIVAKVTKAEERELSNLPCSGRAEGAGAISLSPLFDRFREELTAQVRPIQAALMQLAVESNQRLPERWADFRASESPCQEPDVAGLEAVSDRLL